MSGLERRGFVRSAADPLLLTALVTGALFHGALLAMGSFRRTYDAYVHIFFADHYARGWFETWEPRWYTGFTVTSYPPGTHQLVALSSRLIGLEAAFVVIQLIGVLLVILGVYRLALLIGARRSAGFAAVLAALATGIGEAVHVFGQLPTICAIGVLLNSLPHVRRWIVDGSRRDLAASVALLAGTTALHHVTTLFGVVFFVGPVVVDGLVERFRTPLAGESPARPVRISRQLLVPLVARRLRRVVRPLRRATGLGLLAVFVLVGVVLPYWVWSRTDPIVQIPIPHGSRENFLADRNAGLVFWLIPWGPMLLALPYALWRGVRSSAWPYAASIAVLTLLGTGGTTPIPRAMLRGAFEILTLDRFTFWATILVLPFAGILAADLVDGAVSARVRAAFGTLGLRLVQSVLVVAVIGSAILTVNLTQFRRMQPEPIDPAPIVSFLERDQHWQWRYLTLGFGDQMAWLSAQTTAQTVDGNYHSARRLPEMITTPVERLEGAKFRGVPGLGSLQQFLAVPAKYHLKYVFSNDQFYDPLLEFSGWRRLGRLENDVVVWEREDVPPMPAVVERQELPLHYRLMWGLLPPAALICAAAVAIGAVAASRRPAPRLAPGASAADALETWFERYATVPELDEATVAASWKEPIRNLLARLRPSDRVLRIVGGALAGLAVVAAVAALGSGQGSGPADEVVAYYDDLDFRRFEDAWERLDPATRPSLSDYLVSLSVEDGLVSSYAFLDAVEIQEVTLEGDRASVHVELRYVTSLSEYREEEYLELVKRAGDWSIRLSARPEDEPVERLARRASVEYATMGRRTVTSGTTEYDDVLDRPELDVAVSRVVLFDGRPSVVGIARNADVDPAAVTISAQLIDGEGEVAADYSAATRMQHSLLPGESTPFRVDFEGVAGRDEESSFRPDAYVPIEPVDGVESVVTYAAAVVTDRGLERPVVLTDLVATLGEGRTPRLAGSLFNVGTEGATVVSLLIGLYDESGDLIWVDRVIVPDAARPGIATRFDVPLTPRQRIEAVASDAALVANGLPQLGDQRMKLAGLIPLPAASGYTALTVQAVAFSRSTS